MKKTGVINIIKKDGTIDSKTIKEAAQEGREKDGMDLRTTSQRIKTMIEEQNTKKSA